MQYKSRSTRFAVLGVVMLALGACDDSSNSVSPVTLTPASFSVVGGTGQTGVVGAALATPVAVKVVDANGNAVPNVAVTFIPAASSGSVSGSPSMTDSSGTAIAIWSLGQAAGTDSLQITMGSLASQTVTATANADGAMNIVIVSGNDQSGSIGTALGTPLVVRVTDRYGNPVAGTSVIWSDDSGGTLGSGTISTDASGLASQTLVLGPNGGTETIAATITTAAGTVASVTFTASGS